MKPINTHCGQNLILFITEAAGAYRLYLQKIMYRNFDHF
jgi:hypothetical protein